MKKNPIIDDAIAGLKREFPDIHSRFFTKRLDFHHPEYTPLKYLQLSLATHLIINPNSFIEITWAIAALKMVKHNFPCYHLTQTFCEAIDATNPPLDIKGMDLHFPFSAFAVFLPSSFTKAVFHTKINYLLILKCMDKEIFNASWTKTEIENEGEKLCFLAGCFSTLQGWPIHYTLLSRSTDSFSRTFNQDCFTDLSESLESPPEFENLELSKEAEKALPRQLGVFGFKLLSVLNTAPQLFPIIPKPHMVYSSSSTPKQYFPALWIGQDY